MANIFALAENYPGKILGLCLTNSTAQADSKERKINRDRAIKAVKQNYKSFVSMAVTILFPEENREQVFQRVISFLSGETGSGAPEKPPLVDEFTRNYPNPFSNQTTVDISLSKNDDSHKSLQDGLRNSQSRVL